jgi:hypothetical protein
MWTRRQFLSRSGLGLLGTAGTCLAVGGDSTERPGPRDAIPDGSASKGMITRQADQAIQRGLGYLNSQRRPDGSFGVLRYRGNVAVSSLAGMAFMCAGSQPNRGPYGRAITDALRFVLSKENAFPGGRPGFLHNPMGGTTHGPMYGHGFATLFLGEVYGMVHEKELRQEVHDKLRRAARLIINGQNFQGGWRYQPRSPDADISVTICQIMALRSARNAGVDVPYKPTIAKCIDYVKACQDKREGWFRYQPHGMGGGGPQGFARTAAGVSALYSAGIYQGPEIRLGLDFLVRNKPHVGFGRPDMHYFYGHYYAVQAMWTAGGSYWSEWYPYVRDELLAQQNPDGSWVDQIDPHYATAMACIILQVPNNYLPILQK